MVEKKATVETKYSFGCKTIGSSEEKGKTSHFFRGILAEWFSELMGGEILYEGVSCVNEGR